MCTFPLIKIYCYCFLFIKISEEIDLLQEKLNVKTEKLNVMKGRRDELSRKLDETETHLKQVSLDILFRKFIDQTLKTFFISSFSCWTHLMWF